MLEYKSTPIKKGANTVEKEIRIKIRSELYEVEESLFSDGSDEDKEIMCDTNDEYDAEPSVMEINTFGRLTDDGNCVCITYEEDEESGMSGSTTTVSYQKSNPEIVTMTRDGFMSASLVFEESKRHHCMYKTPYMPFEVCVHTKKVVNTLETDGNIDLDYIVEIRGATAERTKFKMKIL